MRSQTLLGTPPPSPVSAMDPCLLPSLHEIPKLSNLKQTNFKWHHGRKLGRWEWMEGVEGGGEGRVEGGREEWREEGRSGGREEGVEGGKKKESG